MFDSLLGVNNREFETQLLILEQGKWQKKHGDVQLRHATQLPAYWAHRNMDAALFHPEQATGIDNCMSAVRAYYQHIDNGNLQAVRNCFTADSHVQPFPFRRHLASEVFDELLGTVTIGHLQSGTRYLRANDAMTSHEQIARFYSPEGRKLQGEHVLNTIAGIRGLIYAFGIFQGKDHEEKDVEISFGDVWHFANGSTEVVERRTYLENDPETLLNESNVLITPQHMLDKTSLIMRTGPLEDTTSSLVVEFKGFDHNPNLGHLMLRHNGVLKHYFNVDGEKIR